jgi:hypothetical protein
VSTASFSIRSSSSDRELVFSNLDGDYFTVELLGSSVRSTRHVYAYTDAKGLARFFATLAAHSHPWAGAESWGSIEGEFKLSAECSTVGHVSFKIEICDMFGGPEQWQLSAVLATELELLPAIAANAKSFFGV